jgi:hypothetical protein
MDQGEMIGALLIANFITMIGRVIVNALFNRD